jgi:hypothetical protein
MTHRRTVPRCKGPGYHNCHKYYASSGRITLKVKFDTEKEALMNSDPTSHTSMSAINVFELLDGLRISRILIRVILQCQLFPSSPKQIGQNY